MANKLIKPADAQQWADILLNPEMANRLTVRQAGAMQENIRTFRAQQASAYQGFLDDGLDEAQATALLSKQNQALNDGSAEAGGTLKKGGPHPQQQQVFAVAKALNAGVEGAWRAVEGVGGLATGVGVLLNLTDKDAEARYKQAVGNNRLERAKADIDTFGTLNSKLLETIGESVPWMLTAPVGASGGLIRYALNQAMVGGLATASVSNDPLQERGGQFAVGAGLGGAFGGIFGIPGRLKSGIAGAMVKKINVETAAANTELEQAVRTMVNDGDFGFSLSQVTGDRFVFGLEVRAAGDVQKKQQNKNMQILFDNILTRAKEMGDNGRSANEIGLALRGQLKKASDSIYDNASKNFGESLDLIAENYGDDIILNNAGAGNYLAVMDDIMAQMSDGLNPGGNVSAAFKKYREQVNRLVNPAIPKARLVKGPDGKQQYVFDILNRRTGEVIEFGGSRGAARTEALMINETAGGLTAPETRRVQLGLNNLLRGKTAVMDTPDPNTNKHLAHVLVGSLFENLEAHAANPKAVEDLLAMSNAYKAEMLRVNAIEDLVVNRVFGLPQMPANADAALTEVLSSGSSSLEATREFLLEWNPQLLSELQGTLYRRILESAGEAAGAAVDVPISLAKFANALSGVGKEANVIGEVGRGLFNTQQQGYLKTTARALRTINNAYFTGITPGGTTVDDLAINLVSRSPEFMSRFLTRALTTGKGMDAVLTDPMTRQALVTIAEKGPTSRAGNAAMLVLANWITVNEAEDKANEQSDRSAEADRRTGAQ